ncbi:hypothetical protein GCM10020221_11890 [Streptomyces thioluteus]|uniref:Integral membrane protein n=1 Tax=Streptomyces thioluteus TaxID=66431 RepID=A0ABN3WL66_STRTU
MLLGAGLAALLHPGPYVCAALAVVCVGLLYLLMATGYIVASACIGAYVVFLLGIVGEGWSQTVEARVALTLLGGLLAMAAYAMFPVWETARLRDRLADWLETNGAYALAVLDAYARPAEHRPRRVRDTLLDSRAARTTWEETAERALKEPVRHRGLSRTAERAADTALATMGRVTMLMEAHTPDRDAQPSPYAGKFADACATPCRTRWPRCGSGGRRTGGGRARRSPTGTRPRATGAWRCAARSCWWTRSTSWAAALSPGPGGRNRAARRA